MISKRVFTITELVSYIKDKLKSDYVLNNISVKGEIGNFTSHFSGHWYFTLKDNDALINCAMFKSYNYRVSDKPVNGDSVIITGNVNIFEKSGQLQIVVTSLAIDGTGNFYKQFEATRRKLEPLGFFDVKNKKPMPLYPEKIAVITGANTAALQDIKITLAKRWPIATIYEVNALVQGREAIDSICNALVKADKLNADVIILARGGGSVDDLWCFNDEKIAVTIYNCQTPIVSGIGHEIDTTIADLVADKRAATPTAAAVACCRDIVEVNNEINDMLYTMKDSIESKLNRYQQYNDYLDTKLNSFVNKVYAYDNLLNKYTGNIKLAFINKLNDTNKKYTYLNNEFYSSLNKLYNITDKKFNNTVNSFYNSLESIRNRSYKYSLSIDKNIETITSESKHILENNKQTLLNKMSLLSAVNPMNLLIKGYSLTKQKDSIIKSVEDIDLNQNITVRFSDGSLIAKPIERKK